MRFDGGVELLMAIFYKTHIISAMRSIGMTWFLWYRKGRKKR
jgi:hypothetical protein